jgi:hypothetical protein
MVFIYFVISKYEKFFFKIYKNHKISYLQDTKFIFHRIQLNIIKTHDNHK